MGTNYILYNPGAGSGLPEGPVPGLPPEAPQVRLDMTAIDDLGAFLGGLSREDTLILAGGDGTLNHFVNSVPEQSLPERVLYWPIGTGNDLARDLGHEAGCAPFPVGHCLKALPTVTVNGRKRYFLNAVGFGIDGYCCQEGDRLRQIPGKKVNYTAIAIRGLLGGLPPRNATVTVDGVRHSFRKVWIAPTMLGRFYGGGMMAAPEQDRLDPEGQLSLVVFHGTGKLRTLMIFPGIFKGTHVRHREAVRILRGHRITVEFDRPTPLQIDGETIPGVTSYSVFRD